MYLKINSQSQLGLIPNSGIKFHIIGIGGIGMSAIAEVLHSNGIFVQGSDEKNNDNIQKLQSVGVKCYIGHDIKHIENVDIIAYSSAIKTHNLEYSAAISSNRLMMCRHQLLREITLNTWNICVSGMHGKTTTTSMIALVFEYAKQRFFTIVGGIMQYNQSNTIIHSNPRWAIIEADESDDSFIKIPTTIAVITNISPEHLDYHLTFDVIKEKFLQFLENVPYYGFGVVCIDDSAINQILEQVSVNKKIYSYSMQNDKANFFAKNIKIIENNKISFDVYVNQIFFDNFIINIFGKFNISNCLATIAVTHQLKIDKNIIKKALFDFRSTKRRFEILGEFEGATVIDDYAHHPKEIDAVLKTAKDLADFRKSSLFVVFQPHRYSRIQKLYTLFVETFTKHWLENLIILPIYSAGENPIQNINSENLVQQIGEYSKLCEYDISKLKIALKTVKKNDVIIFMGAGDVTKLANEIVDSSINLTV